MNQCIICTEAQTIFASLQDLLSLMAWNPRKCNQNLLVDLGCINISSVAVMATGPCKWVDCSRPSERMPFVGVSSTKPYSIIPLEVAGRTTIATNQLLCRLDT